MVQLRRGRGLGGVDHRPHPVLRDEPGEMRSGTERSAVDLGQAERRVVGSDHDVGVADETDAPAEAEPVYRRDHGHLAVVDGGERGGASPVHPDECLVATGLDLLDVHAGAESPALGPQHHDPDLGILARGDQRVGQGEPRRHVERVYRRDVDDDFGDPGPWLMNFDPHIAPWSRGPSDSASGGEQQGRPAFAGAASFVTPWTRHRARLPFPGARDADFEGRVVIVTGGSRGIGRAIAEAFLRSGADVVVCARNDPGGERPAILGRAGRQSFVQADIRQPEEAKRLVDEAATLFGHLDVLVNNAGGSPAVPAAEASPRFVRSVVELNLLAPFFCAQAANAVMQAQAAGGVITQYRERLGDPTLARDRRVRGGQGGPRQSDFHARRRVGAQGQGELPGRRLDRDRDGGVALRRAQGMAAVATDRALGRFGTPEDIAGLCLLLASPLASYVSGAVLVAHGGGERPAYLTALESVT